MRGNGQYWNAKYRGAQCWDAQEKLFEVYARKLGFKSIPSAASATRAPDL